MRSKYNVFWLDDNITKSGTLKTTIQELENYLLDKGFECVFEKFSTFEDAERRIKNNKKVDLFITDYNIGDESQTGLDFLKVVREKYRKEMLLYSNNDMDTISNYIISKIESKEIDLNFFTKFTFESTLRNEVLIRAIKQVVDETLIRWEELNALRGLYLAEISQREENLKKYICKHNGDITFCNLLKNNIISHNSNHSLSIDIKRKINSIESCLHNGRLSIDDKRLTFSNISILLSDYNTTEFSNWEEIRKLRNGFAHISEDPAGDKIILFDGTIINESDIYMYRKKLISFLNFIDSKYI